MASPRSNAQRYLVPVLFLASIALANLGCDGGNDGLGPDPGPEPPATVNIAVSTTGEEIPATYSLTVTSSDGSVEDTGTILVNGTRTFPNVPARVTIQAQLGGIPVNCTVSTQNPQSVTTQPGQQVTLSFQVACVPVVGSVQIITATTGTHLDPDGYSATVSGVTEAIGVNDTRTFAGLSVGDHTAELSGVDPTCVLGGENPRTLSVAFGQTAGSTFQVTCPESLVVRTQTIGQNLDPNGYTITADLAPAGVVGTNGSSTVGLLPGVHSLRLGDVAANCTVTGENPRDVTLETGAGGEVLFEVTCQPNSGSITVQTTTTGWDLPGSYGLTVDLQGQGNVGATAQSVLAGFTGGAHSVQLTGVPPNCSVQGGNPQTVTVVIGQTVQAPFTVACGGITYESNQTGEFEIFVANSDGSGSPTRFFGTLATDQDPAWSPDRTKLAYACQPGFSQEICIRSADEPGIILPTPLMNDVFTDIDPAWSPDGAKIAFKSNKDGDWEVFVMNTDGTGLVQLTNNGANDHDPSWSPDGQQIVFHSDRDGDLELYVMNADGSSGEAPVQLTNNVTNEEDPAWSPDGNTIAFVSDRHGAREIFLISADGSSGQNFIRLTTNLDDDENPAWSPDGTRIAFTSDRDGDDEIYIMMADGSSGENPFQLTRNRRTDDDANWRD